MKEKLRSLKRILIVFIPILICHFAIFLAFYPGICAYDLNTQVMQYTEHIFRTNHPLLHTLFIGFFHDFFVKETINDYNSGYAIATIIQMLLADGAMTYSVLYVYSLCRKKAVCIFMTAYFALFPVCSLLAITHTKDVMFGIFGLIFFIDSLRVVTDNRIPSYPIMFRMILTAVLMIMNRNNAVYAAVVAAVLLMIILLIKYRRKEDIDNLRRYVILFLISVILAIGSNKALYHMTDAVNGSIKEMMSLPGQIMGRIHNTVATEEEKELIERYIPNTEEYNYFLADPMKHYLPFEIWESKCKHFLLDSAIISLHHPIVALQAVWYNDQGFFDLFHQPYSDNVFYLARSDYRGDAVYDSKIPALGQAYISVFYNTQKISHTPFIVIMGMALYVWILLISFFFSLRKIKTSNNYLAFIFPIMYLCTLLLGPGAIIRYIYIYILSAPVYIMSVAFSKSDD